MMKFSLDLYIFRYNVIYKKKGQKMRDNRKFRIAQDENHLDIDCKGATGLTWSHYTIDEAYRTYKKLFKDCVIVLVREKEDEEK